MFHLVFYSIWTGVISLETKAVPLLGQRLERTLQLVVGTSAEVAAIGEARGSREAVLEAITFRCVSTLASGFYWSFIRSKKNTITISFFLSQKHVFMASMELGRSIQRFRQSKEMACFPMDDENRPPCNSFWGIFGAGVWVLHWGTPETASWFEWN